MAHSPIIFVAAGAFLSYILYTRITLYLARRRFQKEHGCKPNPHVFHKDPILGLDVMHMMTKNHRNHVMLEENKKRFERMGNTFHTRLGATPTIATIEPENIKTILSLKFKDFSIGNRTASFTPLLGHGIFNADGERWASSRHLLRPSFARDQIADLEAFERHFKIMVRHIPKNGATVDLQELFFHLSIDTASEFLFNHSANTLRMIGQDGENNEDVIFAKAFSIAQDDIVTRVRLGPIDRFRKKTKEIEAIQICHAYVDKYVDVALRYRKEMNEEKEVGSQQEERYVFIQELAKQTTDRNRLRDELLNILLAGRDTTASLLSNMFFCLAKDPAVYAKLRAEVAQLEGRVPTYEELRNFKYLKWCLNESLRLHPVVPGNSRFCIRDTILPLGGGEDGKSPLFVPKGTNVGYSPFVMHRREDIYGLDASEYRPERWETLRPGWEYLPFNGGPRICLGQQYALTEAGYITVRLVQEFAMMESRDPGPWRESIKLTLASLNGTKVGLTPA